MRVKPRPALANVQPVVSSRASGLARASDGGSGAGDGNRKYRWGTAANVTLAAEVIQGFGPGERTWGTVATLVSDESRHCRIYTFIC